jgi:hypothetical protein
MYFLHYATHSEKDSRPGFKLVLKLKEVFKCPKCPSQIPLLSRWFCLFTPTAAVFIEVVKGRLLREFELDADATDYISV